MFAILLPTNSILSVLSKADLRHGHRHIVAPCQDTVQARGANTRTVPAGHGMVLPWLRSQPLPVKIHVLPQHLIESLSSLYHHHLCQVYLPFPFFRGSTEMFAMSVVEKAGIPIAQPYARLCLVGIQRNRAIRPLGSESMSDVNFPIPWYSLSLMVTVPCTVQPLSVRWPS